MLYSMDFGLFSLNSEEPLKISKPSNNESRFAFARL